MKNEETPGPPLWAPARGECFTSGMLPDSFRKASGKSWVQPARLQSDVAPKRCNYLPDSFRIASRSFRGSSFKNTFGHLAPMCDDTH